MRRVIVLVRESPLRPGRAARVAPGPGRARAGGGEAGAAPRVRPARAVPRTRARANRRSGARGLGPERPPARTVPRPRDPTGPALPPVGGPRVAGRPSRVRPRGASADVP